ncbi:MAG: hypothetical protein RR521_03705 [Clostridia bacterium]
MINPMTFGAQLAQLLAAHQLSATTIGAHIGGRANLKHALENQLSDARQLTLMQSLSQTGFFSPEELAALEQARQVSRIGPSRYLTQIAFSHLFSSSVPPQPKPMMLDNGKPFAWRVEQLANADQIRILCCNCFFPALFMALRQLFDHQLLDMRMTHHIRQPQDGVSLAVCVDCAMPLVFDSRYTAYCSQQDSASSNDTSIGTNLLCIQAVKQGKTNEFFYLFSDEHTMFELQNVQRVEMYAFFTQISTRMVPPLKSLKVNSKMDVATFGSMFLACLSRELNRSTYTFCSSFCFLMLPKEVCASLLEGMGSLSPALLEKLVALHEQRFNNFYTKKKQHYTIMSPQSCRSFMETGRIADHSVFKRHLLPQERLTVLRTFLEQIAHNPYYHPHLTKLAPCAKMTYSTCYANLSVGIYQMNALAGINQNYDFALIDQPAYVQQYTEHYLYYLNNAQCQTEAESRAFFQALYREYQAKFEPSAAEATNG